MVGNSGSSDVVVTNYLLTSRENRSRFEWGGQPLRVRVHIWNLKHGSKSFKSAPYPWRQVFYCTRICAGRIK